MALISRGPSVIRFWRQSRLPHLWSGMRPPRFVEEYGLCLVADRCRTWQSKSFAAEQRDLVAWSATRAVISTAC